MMANDGGGGGGGVGGGRGGGGEGVFSSGLPEEEQEAPRRTRMMTHTMRERLSEKNGPHKTVFGVLSNKKYEVCEEDHALRTIQTKHSSVCMIYEHNTDI